MDRNINNINDFLEGSEPPKPSKTSKDTATCSSDVNKKVTLHTNK